MKSNYLCMNTRKVEYLWIIKDFTDYFKFVNKEYGYNVESMKFDVYGTEECRFYLKMNFQSEFVECNLKWNESQGSEIIAGQLLILNKNNEKFKTIDVHIRPKAVDDGKSLSLKVERNDLLSKAFDLFPDNNLKVLCNLDVFDKYGNRKLFNTPKQHQSMKDHFKKLLDSQSGSDVVFEVDGQEFKLHKSILMARSPVFLAMFNNDMIENNTNRVEVEDISSSIFELMIHFIYTDEITKKFDVETGLDLLKAATKYQLDGLEALCGTELCNLLTANNAMDTLVIAELHNFTNLVETIKNFIKIHRKEIQSVIKSEHFSKYPHHVSLFFT